MYESSTFRTRKKTLALLNLDINLGWIALFFGVNEDVGVNVLVVDDFPRLFTWIQKLKEHPTVKTNFPSHQEFDYYKQNRETIGPSKIEWIMARTDICMI